MERIIDKFIKKYSENLRYYALRYKGEKVKTIYVFDKHGRNVAVINIVELIFRADSIRLQITISGNLYDEVSSVIGVTFFEDSKSYLAYREYFKEQFGNQITDEVSDYVLQNHNGKVIVDTESLLSVTRLDKRESEMVGRDSEDDRFSYTVERI